MGNRSGSYRSADPPRPSGDTETGMTQVAEAGVLFLSCFHQGGSGVAQPPCAQVQLEHVATPELSSRFAVPATPALAPTSSRGPELSWRRWGAHRAHRVMPVQGREQDT